MIKTQWKEVKKEERTQIATEGSERERENADEKSSIENGR